MYKRWRIREHLPFAISMHNCVIVAMHIIYYTCPHAYSTFVNSLTIFILDSTQVDQPTYILQSTRHNRCQQLYHSRQVDHNNHYGYNLWSIRVCLWSILVTFIPHENATLSMYIYIYFCKESWVYPWTKYQNVRCLVCSYGYSIQQTSALTTPFFKMHAQFM